MSARHDLQRVLQIGNEHERSRRLSLRSRPNATCASVTINTSLTSLIDARICANLNLKMFPSCFGEGKSLTQRRSRLVNGFRK